MCGSMADIQSPMAEIRRGKKERYKKKPQGKNLMACPIPQGGHNEQYTVYTPCSLPYSKPDAVHRHMNF